jgi:hypothetical protein
MVIRHYAIKILNSEAQFVLEVCAEGWIGKNFIDMALGISRLVINCPLFWTRWSVIGWHSYPPYLATDPYADPRLSTLILQQVSECQ